MAVSNNFALSFNGSSDYVNLIQSYNYLSSGITVEALVNSTLTSKAEECIVGNYESGGYGLVLKDNKWGVVAHINGSYSVLYDDKIVTKNEWTPIAFTYDGGTLKFYVDGILKSSKSIAGVIKSVSQPLLIGGNPPVNLDYKLFFGGMIDEVRIWSKPLLQEEINKNKKRVLKGNEDGLIGYWRFEEGSGTTVKDKSSLNNSGNIIRATWTTGGVDLISDKILIKKSDGVYVYYGQNPTTLDNEWINLGESPTDEDWLNKGTDVVTQSQLEKLSQQEIVGRFAVKRL